MKRKSNKPEVSPEEKKKRSAHGKKSRAKGAVYERDVVNSANPILEPMGWVLNRTPRSGGWIAMQKDPSFARLRSDITAPEDFPLFLECKARESWSFDQVLKGGFENWEPLAWYCEAREKAEDAGKVPLMVFTKNFQPHLIMISVGHFNEYWPPDKSAPEIVAMNDFYFMQLEPFLEGFVETELARRRAREEAPS